VRKQASEDAAAAKRRYGGAFSRPNGAAALSRPDPPDAQVTSQLPPGAPLAASYGASVAAADAARAVTRHQATAVAATLEAARRTAWAAHCAALGADPTPPAPSFAEWLAATEATRRRRTASEGKDCDWREVDSAAAQWLGEARRLVGQREGADGGAVNGADGGAGAGAEDAEDDFASGPRAPFFSVPPCDDEARRLIGDSAPQRVVAESGGRAGGSLPGPSAWNAAGYAWEDVDSSAWAKARLENLLGGAGGAGGGAGLVFAVPVPVPVVARTSAAASLVVVGLVGRVFGWASRRTVRGSITPWFEFGLNLRWRIVSESEAAAPMVGIAPGQLDSTVMVAGVASFEGLCPDDALKGSSTGPLGEAQCRVARLELTEGSGSRAQRQPLVDALVTASADGLRPFLARELARLVQELGEP